MTHILIIAAFIILLLRESLVDPREPTLLLRHLGPGTAALAALALMALVWLSAHLLLSIQARRLDRGEDAAIFWSDRILSLSRLAALAAHAVNILFFGWLDITRLWLGDTIVLDEFLAVAPVLLAFVGGWWSMYPVERRIRDAILLRDLDLGHPIRPMPARWAFVVATLRHQAAMVLVPILIILAWREAIEFGIRRDLFPEWLPTEGLQFAGAILALMMMPLVLRRVWDTIHLEPGPLRDDLVAMCRDHRVRVRDVLLWRTHGTMINGAVLGLIGPARYVLLTDALLECLPGEQVRAVMAHELGHIRRRHMPWLAAAVLCGIILAAAAVDLLLRLYFPSIALTRYGEAAIIILGMSAGLFAFGFASRRFEWQADAFAVQHLSGYRGRDSGPILIAAGAVHAMTAALGSVAALNHIPLHRFTWRHGSIASRQRRLRALVGLPAGRLKPDRDAAFVKGLILAAILAVAALFILAS